jgi:peptide/nickel transport system substrate-binding protein
VTAAVIRDKLALRLGGNLGPAYEDVREIRAVSDYELEFVLRQPSAFLSEALDVPIEGPEETGTGPFKFSRQGPDGIEMQANTAYYQGPPEIERVRFKPYNSTRAAWADLLRGQVDMLYEVGVEALDSLTPSNRVKVFSYRRHYAYMAIMNVARPALRDAALRRTLNLAIDRQTLLSQVMAGRGIPAATPVWPDHWANAGANAVFAYDPQPIAPQTAPLRLRCLFIEPSHERLALALQQQLRAVGVELVLESAPLDAAMERLTAGDFDILLTEVISGPSLSRPYLFWHSNGPFNWGRYRSSAADRGLDTIRHATTDEVYKQGVAAFQRAIADDPPAIFLAWIERARAVSTRFEVPVEPGRDVWSSLRLWHPVTGASLASGH